MRYPDKARKLSFAARLKGFFTGESSSSKGMADAPYRSTSRRSMASSEWFPSSASADEALIGAIPTLRDQSRDLDRNEGIARGAVENFVTNVVSDGIRAQARIDH